MFRKFMFAFFLASGPAAGFEIIGHRGASHDAPENTVASLRLSWEQGADASELDIRLTRDGKTVVIHDATTRRTTGVDRNVAEATLDELRRLDAGSWKGPRWRSEKTPTLDEAIATLPPGKRLFIEFKCGPEALPEVERAMRESGKPAPQFVLIGFDFATMEEAKRRNPDKEVYWLVSPDKNSGGRSPAAADLAARASRAKLDGLFLNHAFAIDSAFVARVKGAGLRIFAWTVNDPAVARRVKEAGVEGIGTDRPGWMRERL